MNKHFQTPGSRDDLSTSSNLSTTFDEIAAAHAQQDKVQHTPLCIPTDDG